MYFEGADELAGEVEDEADDEEEGEAAGLSAVGAVACGGDIAACSTCDQSASISVELDSGKTEDVDDDRDDDSSDDDDEVRSEEAGTSGSGESVMGVADRDKEPDS